ncbi:MAG: hypothetical protein EXS33_00625 [Pedosphaera sp.]|nr:hypothetical protein [Pedosphaera sp.]
MDDTIPFGSRDYWYFLAAIVFARGMDFLSTWIATPRLKLEANPIAKFLGWKWGIALNVLLAPLLACWPLAAVIVGTTSVLVAARNFQSAWLMRAMGEDEYRRWMCDRMHEGSLRLFVTCLLAQTFLVAMVGAVLIWFTAQLVPFGIGVGIVGYALAVGFYTLLSVWRLRGASR